MSKPNQVSSKADRSFSAPASATAIPVLDGLAPGDKVAAAGAFLIDAESRLNPTAVTAPAKAPDADQTSPAQNRSAAAPTGTAHRH